MRFYPQLCCKQKQKLRQDNRKFRKQMPPLVMLKRKSNALGCNISKHKQMLIGLPNWLKKEWYHRKLRKMRLPKREPPSSHCDRLNSKSTYKNKLWVQVLRGFWRKRPSNYANRSVSLTPQLPPRSQVWFWSE